MVKDVCDIFREWRRSRCQSKRLEASHAHDFRAREGDAAGSFDSASFYLG